MKRKYKQITLLTLLTCLLAACTANTYSTTIIANTQASTTPLTSGTHKLSFESHGHHII